MKNLLFYRIATFILLPIAALLGSFVIQAFFSGFGNPTIMFGVFVNGSLVIYIFSSYAFLRKCVERKELLKPFMKDLIKVNAYITIPYAALICFVSFLVILVPEIIQIVAEQMPTSAGIPSVDPVVFRKETLIRMYFAFPLSIIVLFHIFSTFRLLRQYASLFSDNHKSAN